MLIDFHAHIIPECDHGSDSLETSLRQLERARGAGIDVIVATPHFYMQRQSVETFLLNRERGFNKLLPAAGDSIRIVKAAEVTLSFDLVSLPELEKLCIEGTNYMLLEMPSHNWTRWVLDSIYKITSIRGIRPIIAHIDRYDPDLVSSLLDMDVLFQLNASALLPIVKRGRYRRMIQDGLIHVLGSDAHGTGDEFADYAKAIKLLKDDMHVLTSNSEAILRGEHVLT